MTARVITRIKQHNPHHDFLTKLLKKIIKNRTINKITLMYFVLAPLDEIHYWCEIARQPEDQDVGHQDRAAEYHLNDLMIMSAMRNA